MSKLSEVVGAIAPGTEQIAVTDYRPLPGQTNGIGEDLDYRDFAGLDGGGEVDELDSLGWLGASEDDLVLTIDGLDEGDLGAFMDEVKGGVIINKPSLTQLQAQRAEAHEKLVGLNRKKKKSDNTIRAIAQLGRTITNLDKQIDMMRRAALARGKARSQVVAAMSRSRSKTAPAQIDRAVDAVVRAKVQTDLVPAAKAAPASQQDVSIEVDEGENGLDGLGKSWLERQKDKLTNTIEAATGTARATIKAATGTASALAAKPRSLMDRIIATDKAMTMRVAMNLRAKAKLAAKSPAAAIKLAQQAAKSKQPGTSLSRAVIGGMNTAAKYARLAKQHKAMSAQSMRRNDKRLAAAHMVKALEYARKAGTIATKSEKTRVAVGLDRYQKVFTAQASLLRGAAQKLQRSGTNPGRVAQLMSQASALENNAQKLRAQAANVEAQPNEPKGLPTPKRIAEIANKFNVRTSFKNKAQNRRALLSVLGEAYDAPLAQATDFDGALAYYGGDELGELAAHIEFGNYTEAEALLEGLGDDLGWSTPDWLNKAGDFVKGAVETGKEYLNKGKELAQKIDDNVIKPAAKALGMDKKAVAAAKPPATSAPAATTPAAAAAVDAASSTASGGAALTTSNQAPGSAQAPGAAGDGKIFGLPKMAVYGGGAALVLGAAYFLTRKK